MIFRYFFWLLQLHCCVKTALWDYHLQGELSICWSSSASVGISHCFFLPQTSNKLPTNFHWNRDVTPERLTSRSNYPLLSRCIAACLCHLFGTIQWCFSVCLFLFSFKSYFGQHLLPLLSPQTTPHAGSACMSLGRFWRQCLSTNGTDRAECLWSLRLFYEQ